MSDLKRLICDVEQVYKEYAKTAGHGSIKEGIKKSLELHKLMKEIMTEEKYHEFKNAIQPFVIGEDAAADRFVRIYELVRDERAAMQDSDRDAS